MIPIGIFGGVNSPCDEQANTLTIKIHRMATPAHDKALGLLLADLTDHEFCHPETTAKMIFRLV
jgi:hypothetical protein